MSHRIDPPASNFDAQRAIHGVPLAIIRIVSAYAILGGTVTLCGWAFDLPRLTDWGNSGISMFANTAICAILCGISLLLALAPGIAWRRRAARAAAGLVAVIGGLTLLEHLTGITLGIDTLLIERPWGQRAAVSPMRMGPPASTSFLILGVVLVLTTIGNRARWTASVLAAIPVAVSSLSLTGYLFGANQLFGVARFTAIAWQSSTILAALGIGAIAAIPEHGVSAALSRRDTGGALLRRLAIPIVLIPFLVGWLRLMGQEAGYFDTAFGTALRTLIEIVLLFALIWWTSNGISRHEGLAAEAQGRLATIVESTDDAVVSKLLDGTIRSWNRGAERLFGYSESEAVGQNILFIIPADRTNEEVEILSRLRRGERIEHYETVRIRKDGQLIDVSLTVSPIRDATGNVVGASKIARDITERKRAYEAIRRSEAELVTLADTIPQLAWMANPDGHVFWYNRGWYDYTGTTLEQMQGWGWQSVHDPQMLPTVLERWKQSLATGEPFEMEFPIRGADGRFRWFLTRVNPLRDEQDRVIRWFGTNTDVEQAKRTEETLRDQTRTLELLNETGTVVGSTLELERLLQAVTDIATQLSGAKYGAFFYNTTDENGDSLWLHTLSGAPREAIEKLGHPQATQLFGPKFTGQGPIRSDDVLEDPRYSCMEPHWGMPAGVRSYLAVPVVSRIGEAIGGLFFGHPEVGVFSERTERIIRGVASQAAVAIDNARLYENLRQAAGEREQLLEAERAARSDAERANIIKDEFLATLSHELRTPLSAILGWSQLLATGDMPPEDVAEGLEAIERNARSQTQLIEDLLDMSRIISGKLRLEVQRTDLANVVVQAAESVRPSADAKQIRIRRIIDPNSGPVSGDPTRLQQVIWNLLSNAIKFTPKGGTVDVVVERVNSHLEVTVHDTGIGIKPDVLPLIFERFRQADSSTTRSYGGLGLGLSIVKNLVELHGGTVRAHSAGENQGSTFVVSIPIAPIRIDDKREHPSTARASRIDFDHVRLTGLKVLIVDDEPDSRELLKRVLSQCEAEVTTAKNGMEGLDLIRSTKLDVIVSDIGMPGMDGYEFMRKVRNLTPAEHSKIPAIALTAFARSEDRTKAMLAGYQVHVAKPIEPQELVATVGSLTRRIN
jgi:PAS domain S-box-containing protein